MNPRVKRNSSSGFTLAEALAALAFLAAVLPVAMEGLRIASLAGGVAERKAAASRAGDRVLNELLIANQWQQSAGSGTVQESGRDYSWRLSQEAWALDSMRLLILEIDYQVQGNNYSVQLSTLADVSP